MLSIRSKVLSVSLVASAVFASPMALAAVDPIHTVDTQIFRLQSPSAGSTDYGVLSTAEGAVYSVSPDQGPLFKKVKKLAARRASVHLETIDDRVVKVTEMIPAEAGEYSDDVSNIPTSELNAMVDGNAGHTGVAAIPGSSQDRNGPSASSSSPAIAEFAQNGYQPTILNSMEEAHNLFAYENVVDAVHTQCHERAMYWTYKMHKWSNVNSMKVMMFYTPKLINTFVYRWPLGTKKYKWWYHTAPYVFVRDAQGGLQEVVLDKSFLPSEVTLDEWTHFFIGEETRLFVDADHRDWMPQLSLQDTHCRVMSNYREYNQIQDTYANTESAYKDQMKQHDGDYSKLQFGLQIHASEPWCMVRKYPMYYMQPNSVEAMDCDPSHDPAHGKPAVRLPNGLIKYPCQRALRYSFTDKNVGDDVIRAFKSVSPDEVDQVKSDLGR